MPAKRIDLTGQRFGRWLVIRCTDNGLIKNHKKRPWLCRCDCGVEREILKENLRVRSGRTASCGCAHKEQTTKHGHRAGALRGHSLTYNSWSGMIRRCYDPVCRSFEVYGRIGIVVCDRWRGTDGFSNFLKDMGERPSAKHSLDRIDSTGNYTLDNCRWATTIQQINNRRTTRSIIVDGKRISIGDLARQHGIDYKVLAGRLSYGWDVHRAVSTPVRKGRET